MDVRVLLEGPLEKCTGTDFEEHGKRDWKRRHFVLKHVLASNIRSLEFYAAGTKNWRKAEPKGVLTLYPGFEVVKVHEPKRHFVFEIKTVDHTFRLAAHSEDELNQWILVLEKENIVNSFYVEPELTEAMSKLGATDMCHLNIAKKELCLFSARDGRLLVAWPFTCLRRYMSKQGKFTVEAGRRAPTGQGQFTFLTPQHDEIYKHLDSVIKSTAGPATSAPPSHGHLTRTQSAPINTGLDQPDGPENGYDHLTSHMSPTQAHAPIPGNSPSSSKTGSLSGGYASPYGHLLTRDKITGTSTAGQGLPLSGPGKRSSGVADELDQYSTLDHGSDGLQGPVDPAIDVYCTLDQTAARDTKDMYNILAHGSSPSPRLVQRGECTEDVYNVIGETLKPLASAFEPAIEEDMYNTLDLGPTPQVNVKPVPPPEQDSVYDSLDQPTLPATAAAPQLDQMYSKLDHGSPVRPRRQDVHPPAVPDAHDNLNQPPLSPKRKSKVPSKPPKPPVRKSSDLLNKQQASKQSSFDEGDVYNTLNVPPTAPMRKSPEQVKPLSSHLPASCDDDDMYNTLDATRAGPPTTAPARTPPTSPPPYNRNEANRSSTSSLQSGRCPLNVPPSQSEMHAGRASSVDDLDSYASINYSAMSPPKGAQKQRPVPAQRSVPSKAVPSKSRKTSAPDVLSVAVDHSGKDTKKGGRLGLVSNLRASLEAGGLDLTKAKRKAKKLSREESEEIPEVTEQGARHSYGDDHVFLPGTPPTRDIRSRSSPSESASFEGDQIYDELDHHTAEVRPKSLQMTKARNSPKK